MITIKSFKMTKALKYREHIYQSIRFYRRLLKKCANRLSHTYKHEKTSRSLHVAIVLNNRWHLNVTGFLFPWLGLSDLMIIRILFSSNHFLRLIKSYVFECLFNIVLHGILKTIFSHIIYIQQWAHCLIADVYTKRVIFLVDSCSRRQLDRILRVYDV